jgi:chemotaxis protein MotB
LQRQLQAAIAAQIAAQDQAATRLSESERQSALLAEARAALAERDDTARADAGRMALLNSQLAELRAQIADLQSVVGAANDRDDANRAELALKGEELNTALARAALAEKKLREAEAAENVRLAAENKRLEKYRSDFFGRLRDLLGDREGVQIVGDRFVFSSEVLFDVGSADLSDEGKAQIARVAAILDEISGEIPPGIDWIIRVDGHTDDVPVSGGAFRDNWGLSQARALSVVRYMIDDLDFPPDRLAATGFGEWQPLDRADTPEARAKNRRIELKLTER